MAEKRRERVMVVSGLVSGIRHAEPDKDGAGRRAITGPSYVTLDIIGSQLNFPLEYEVASKLNLYDPAVFEFEMRPRLLNGRNSPYCVFSPFRARYLGQE